ncbi:Flp/Fap pilin component [Solidesulfovibrio carbinoliphilus subsp. oakridgensis]|uniref:Flp/Fap pilin component n=1 Tax=Solidesulfovibrio carbinoliphilus subsp. oakridgensis TaxID=694327 RepID=G7QBQ8_9BACT|nr:Flp family type IVb pilin [Solidesulfovibrio carbinoliphilus]EHJ49401.1 Flp/Fap pilin component [Solidesulfovibrio carbinoliphilus subsp. oakridgensis]
MADRILRFLNDESGATSSEYAILASLVAGVAVAVVTGFGLSVRALFQKAQDAFPGGGG